MQLMKATRLYTCNTRNDSVGIKIGEKQTVDYCRLAKTSFACHQLHICKQ